MATDPARAREDLKLLMQNVARTVDLSEDTRQLLQNRIIIGIQQAQRRQTEFEAQQLEAQELASVAHERARVIREITEDQAKLKGLSEWFNALMDEGRYHDAVDYPGTEMTEVSPLTAEPWAAVDSGTFYAHRERARELYEQRTRAFVDVLFDVEKSLIPFSGEPPITYPDPDTWRKLTDRRKKYASVDLSSPNSAEQKIYQALEESTQVEFFDTELGAAMEFLAQQHEINIVLDTARLDEIGITSNTIVNQNLKGISLKSALNLILGQFFHNIRGE